MKLRGIYFFHPISSQKYYWQIIPPIFKTINTNAITTHLFTTFCP